MFRSLARAGMSWLIVTALGLGSTASAQTTHQVQAVGFGFEPSMLTITVGDTVQWTNLSGGFHNVRETSTPPGGGSVYNGGFASGPAGSVATFSHTFTSVGDFAYFCETHQPAGMWGTILVRPEVGTAMCFGDPTGPACPCNNNSATPGESCNHSGGHGMTITSSGSNSILLDNLVLTVNGAPPVNAGIFYSGTALIAGNHLFDGLQCALGTTARYQGRFQSTGTVSGTGFVSQVPPGYFTPGTFYYFHYWTRDVAGGPTPCGTNANFSPVYEVMMF